MGKGDKKTAKGKRVMGSYGNSRRRKDTKHVIQPALKSSEPKVEKVKETKVAKEVKATKPAIDKKPTTAKKTTEKKVSAKNEEK